MSTNTSKKDAKKQRILEMALKLFAQKGFKATTTKEIATECGITEGLIFYYFGDKQQLLLQIVKNFGFALRLQGDEEKLAKGSLEEALIQYGMKYLQFLTENRDYIMLIWSPEMIQDDMVSKEVLPLIQGIGTAGRSIFQQGLAGEIPLNETTYAVATTMITSSILIYFLIHFRFGGNIFMLEEEPFIRELVRLTLHGLIGQKAQADCT